MVIANGKIQSIGPAASAQIPQGAQRIDRSGYTVIPGLVGMHVEAAFTPVEAIQIATENGALYLGQQDRIGTLAPGKRADLVLIKGDPSKHIDEIENVETVFKAGIGYDSKKLIDSVRGQVGIR